MPTPRVSVYVYFCVDLLSLSLYVVIGVIRLIGDPGNANSTAGVYTALCLSIFQSIMLYIYKSCEIIKTRLWGGPKETRVRHTSVTGYVAVDTLFFKHCTSRCNCRYNRVCSDADVCSDAVIAHPHFVIIDCFRVRITKLKKKKV